MKHNLPNILSMLERIEKRFYKNQQPRRFYQDKRMLIYTLTWPATWFKQRGLAISQQRYEHIIEQIIKDIIKHGKQNTYQQYFPRYLLKCIQQWFIFHGDSLCDELKHIRNKMWQADSIIQALQKKSGDKEHQQYNNIEAIQKAHLILKKQIRKKQKIEHKQLELL